MVSELDRLSRLEKKYDISLNLDLRNIYIDRSVSKQRSGM